MTKESLPEIFARLFREAEADRDEKTYHSVFCDLDGTLLKPNGDALEEAKKLLLEEGIKPLDISVEPNGIDSIKTLFPNHFERAKEVYNGLLRTGKYTPEPTEGAEVFLRYIKEKGIDFCLVTNGDAVAAETMFMQRFGHIFDKPPIILGDADKPLPEKAQALAYKHGIVPAANGLVHVGDGIGTDAKLAAQLGFIRGTSVPMILLLRGRKIEDIKGYDTLSENARKNIIAIDTLAELPKKLEELREMGPRTPVYRG